MCRISGIKGIKIEGQRKEPSRADSVPHVLGKFGTKGPILPLICMLLNSWIGTNMEHKTSILAYPFFEYSLSSRLEFSAVKGPVSVDNWPFFENLGLGGYVRGPEREGRYISPHRK